MVIRKRKKVRKFRGKRRYGYGKAKKRGAGVRGGRGRAGLHKHKWTWTVKYAPEYFGKKGFRRPLAVVKEIKAINLKDLDKIAEKLLEEKKAEKEEGKIKINLSKIGYDKLLGAGKITKPLIVEAKFFSKTAIKKLEEAGGKAIKIDISLEF